jgi:hypothetical protein
MSVLASACVFVPSLSLSSCPASPLLCAVLTPHHALTLTSLTLTSPLIQLELREYDCGKPSPPTGSDEEANEEKKEPAGSTMTESTDAKQEEDSEMRGVHAVQHIPPNTVCMSVPRRCLITVEMGQATLIGQAILNSDLDLDAPKHIYLMIYVLWDRKVNGTKSFFHPYYQILPPTLSNMPIFWSDDELACLEGSYLLHQIADRNQAITEDYHAICQIAPLQEICSLDEFKWARMCVCSRNFGLQIDGHRTSALVPHADMLNHYRPRETKWTFDEERQAFTITSIQHIPVAAQVYDSYGQKCNHRFLLNYGFAVENNRELDDFCPNEVPVELFVDPVLEENELLLDQKMEFWTRGEMAHYQSTGGITGAGSGSGSAVSGHVTAQMLVQAAQAVGRPIPPHVLQAQAQAQAHAQATGGNANNNNTSNFSAGQLDSMHNGSVSVMKRVRICVSNNENTRLLLSLLRALACNADELKAIATPASNDGVTRALFGLPEVVRGVGGASHSHSHFASLTGALAAAGPGAGYHRSCRDIRHPISLRNERAAMRLLLGVVARHLAMYPTSLAQDVVDLLDERAFPRFGNKRHAKIQVRGEKEVLHHFAQWARTALDVLDVIEEELKEERGSVEVQLTSGGSMVTEERPSFEYIIRRMEEDVNADVHHTILRYCADVLGSLRREEFKSIRRQRAHSRSVEESKSGLKSNSRHSTTGFL